MWYQKLITVLISGFIGYITNYLAIKMIFYPKKELRIKNFKVPFTPGLIPKNRKRLTDSIANNLIDNFLNEDKILNNIDIKELNNSFCEILVDKFESLNLKEKIVNEIFKSMESNLGFFKNIVEGLKPVIENKIEEYFYQNKEKIVDEIVDEKILGNIISKIDLKEILINGLDKLDITEFENILLNILNKELKAITNIGAILGILLGLINILFL